MTEKNNIIDNLSLVVEELNKNKNLDKNLTREQLSKMSYSEVMSYFNRKKGRRDNLFNFTKRIIGKLSSLLRKK